MEKIERLARGIAEQPDHSAALPVLRLDDPIEAGEPLNARLNPIDERPTGGGEAHGAIAVALALRYCNSQREAPTQRFEKIHVLRDDGHVPSVPREISVSCYQPDCVSYWGARQSRWRHEAAPGPVGARVS